MGSILLWSTIDINRYTEILDLWSQKLRVLLQGKKCGERARKFWESQFLKSLLACLGSICGQCKLKLPCHLQWTWHISGFLPAKSFALCSFFCDIQPPGQGCVLIVFFQHCTPNRFLQMNVDYLSNCCSSCGLQERLSLPSVPIQMPLQRSVCEHKQASWFLLRSACTLQQFNLLSIEDQGKHEWCMINRIVT